MVVEMTPTVELPPATPLTSQVTAVLVAPVTVAVNGWVASVANVAEPGEMETATCAGSCRDEAMRRNKRIGKRGKRRSRLNIKNEIRIGLPFSIFYLLRQDGLSY